MGIFIMTIEQLKATFQKYWKVVLFILVLLVFLFMSWKINNLNKQIDKDKVNTQTMTSEHLKNLNAIQNELSVSKQNAEVIKDIVAKALNAKIAPVASFKATSDDGSDIVSTIAKQINTGDSTLPPFVYEKTDKTVVAEQPDNKEYPVGVYKINTYRNWEAGVGVGVESGKAYIPISLQRNYSKDRALEVEVHKGFNADPKITGGAVKYKMMVNF